MVKKTLIAGGALVLLLGLVFGRHLPGYVSTTVAGTQDWAAEQFPVEFDIERARNAMKGLDPEIRKNVHLIAKEEVEVAKLEKTVVKAEEQLAQDRRNIMRLKDALDSGSGNIVLVGHTYSAREVEKDLRNRFENYKNFEDRNENLRKVLNARRSGLTAAKEKLSEMEAQREALKVTIEKLAAQAKMIEVAKTTSEFNFDDSQLGYAREIIENIETRLQVEERMLNVDIDSDHHIPLEEDDLEESSDVSDEVANYFNPNTDTLVAELDGEEF